MKVNSICKDLDKRDIIEKMSKKELKKNLLDALRILKLHEEVGELSEGFLSLVGYKKSDQTKEEILDNMHGEVVDIDIMKKVLGNRFGLSKKKRKKLLKEKLEKWQTKHLSEKEKKNLNKGSKKTK